MSHSRQPGGLGRALAAASRRHRVLERHQNTAAPSTSGGGSEVLPFVYRVTRHNPADRDQHGHHAGTGPATSDHGPVEAACLRAVAAFAEDTGVDRLAVRGPRLGGFARLGLESPSDGYGLPGVFSGGPAGFHGGALVPIAVGLELVRSVLRDRGAWCRLEAEGAFAVHVGRDQCLCIGSSLPCETALARTRALGLFAERLDASPYDFAPDDLPARRRACCRRRVHVRR